MDPRRDARAHHRVSAVPHPDAADHLRVSEAPHPASVVPRPDAEGRRQGALVRLPASADRPRVAAVPHRDATDLRDENHHHRDEEHWDDWACRIKESDHPRFVSTR